jgi:hypothetical protein
MCDKNILQYYLTVGAILLLLLVNCAPTIESVTDNDSLPSSTEASIQFTLPPSNTPSALPATSVPSAISYTDFTQEMGQLDRTLSSREQETYAGLCIITPGKREAAIAFTANAEETASKYLSGQPYEAQVQVWTADYPRELLDKNLRDEMQRIIDLGFYTIGRVDYCKNRILISVVSITEVELALQAADTPLPEYVELMEESMITLEPY